MSEGDFVVDEALTIFASLRAHRELQVDIDDFLRVRLIVPRARQRTIVRLVVTFRRADDFVEGRAADTKRGHAARATRAVRVDSRRLLVMPSAIDQVLSRSSRCLAPL